MKHGLFKITNCTKIIINIYFLHAYFFMLPDGFFTTSYYCN